MALTDLIYNTSKENDREQWRRSLAEAGLTLVAGSFEEGATAQSGNDAVWHIAGGQCYTWGGAFPKNVPAASTPSSGGVAYGAWVNVTSNILRNQLYSASGSQLVNYKLPSAAGSVTRNIESKLAERASVKDFGAKGDGSTDDTIAFQAAATWAASRTYGGIIYVPPGTYNLSNRITWDGGSAQVHWVGENSGFCTLSWVSSSTDCGFAAGLTTPVQRTAVYGLTFATYKVTNKPCILSITNQGSPKNATFVDVNGFGGAVGGTAANGYWGDGLIVLNFPVYPIFQNCQFYGIGGAASVTKSDLINSAYRIFTTAGRGVFFSNFFNCFANNVKNGIWLQTYGNPGIEGTFINSCNFNSCNVGVYAEGQSSGVSAYYPPEVVIQNSQIEYLQRGIYINHHGKVTITGSLLYADPTADVALQHILLVDVEGAIVQNNFMESRPVHTSCEGVEVHGASFNIQVKDNTIQVPSASYGIVFSGSTYNARHSGNMVLIGKHYANVSTNKVSNTPEEYTLSGERSVVIGSKTIMKTGSKVVTLGAGGTFTLNYQVAFPNSFSTVVACNGDVVASGGAVSLGTANVTGFQGVLAGGSSGAPARINYVAYGD